MRLAILLFSAIPVVLFGQVVYLSDDFNDGNADGWTELSTGALYEVNEDMRYQFTAGAGVELAVSYNADGPSGMSVSNYSALTEFSAHNPTHGVALVLRTDAAGEIGYALYIRVNESKVSIFRLSPSGNSQIAQASFDMMYDELYWARFTCYGDAFLGKVWQGEAADEPSSWLLTAVDGTYSDAGYFALWAANIGTATGIDGEFDNVIVSAVPDALQATTWAMIKATL